MDTGSSFNPDVYSDVPLYNIQAVAAATGVPAITLRSWERRYGIPRPKRDPKGYRLYSERDIAITGWLRERVQRGIGISRAVNMLRVLEAGSASPQPQRTFDLGDLRRRLQEAIVRMDELDVSRVVAEALIVAPVEDVVLDLFQPVLYQVGDLWEDGRLSVTTEHVGSNLIRAHLTQLVRISPTPIRPELVVVGSAPGELHDMGALSVALFLRRRGFNVIYAGASVAAEDLVADVERLQPAAVCISASRAETVGAARSVLERLQNVSPARLVYGGRIFNEDPGARDAMPGSFGGDTAARAVRHVEEAALRAPVTPAGE